MRSTLSHIGKYELRSVIARTATSVVYDGWDSGIDRRVAIKTVPLSTLADDETREALARFKRGVQAAGKLTHPNIISIHDYGETDEYAYIVMEFVDGPNLKQLLDSGTHFDLSSICEVMGGILEGLQYSHDRGVVHRDMKPANIMFTKDQRVKITDFGIARLEEHTFSTLTQAGMVIGTPAYMSPEQFMGEEVDWRTDIYSTGVVLYHLITGARPYEGNLTTIMNKVLNAPVPRPSVLSPGVSPVLDQVVTRAMAKKREQRFQSAAEFNAALQAAQARPEHPARPISAPWPEARVPFGRPERRRASRSPALVGGALVVLTAVGLGTGAYLHGPFGLATPPTTHPADADDSLKAAKLAPATPEPSTVAAAPAPQQLVDQAPPSTVPSDTESSIQSGTAPSAAPLLPSPDTSQGNAAAAVPFVPPAPEPPHPLPEPPRSADSGSVRKSDIPTRPVPPRDTHQRQPNRSSDAAKAAERRTDARATDNAGIQEALNRLKGAMPDRDNAAPANSVPDAPPAYPVTSISADVGLLCRSLTPETAQEVGLDSPQGLLVTGVTVGGPADQAGIRANDVILKANGSDIRSIAGLRVAPGQSVAVEILRDRRVITLHLRSAS